jgi:hypothetical protein
MAELYAGESIGAIVLVTGFLGGGAAWLSGRAIAGAWHPPWHVALVALLLGAAARFIHFALFHGELLSAARWCGNIPGSIPAPAPCNGAKLGGKTYRGSDNFGVFC